MPFQIKSRVVDKMSTLGRLLLGGYSAAPPVTNWRSYPAWWTPWWTERGVICLTDGGHLSHQQMGGFGSEHQLQSFSKV